MRPIPERRTPNSAIRSGSSASSHVILRVSAAGAMGKLVCPCSSETSTGKLTLAHATYKSRCDGAPGGFEERATR